MKQYAIIGLGRFGRSVAHTLTKLGHQVLALDNSNRKIIKMLPSVTRTVECDATNESALRASGIKSCEVVVVAVGALETAARIITLLKDFNIKHIIARADNVLDKRILKQTGADRVVMPEFDMGKRVARSITSPHFKEFVEVTNDIGIVELKPTEEMFNKSIRDIELFSQDNIGIIALKNQSNELYYNPCGADIIKENHTILILGDISKLQKIQEQKK